MPQLLVWIAGRQVATITESRRKMRLTYTDDAGPLGRPLISVAMPTSRSPYTDTVVRPYFQGLLPEGPARLMIAYDFGLDATDDFGLLAALGRDCAGALVILPEGEIPRPIDQHPAELLTNDDVERRLLSLPTHPLGVSSSIRASLPGVQAKLLLARVEGAWASPSHERPSTHILKPAVPHLTDAVTNEVFCMNLAAASNLRAATTVAAQFGQTVVAISERFDRRPGSHGDTVRIHQEDACQALSIVTRHPQQKYQTHGGPTLRQIAGVLTQWRGSTTEFLEHVAFSVVVGNADFHGKNVSFLHHDDGTISLTPLYDVLCTTHYDGNDGRAVVDTELALFIDGQTDILRVTKDNLASEAANWGMRRSFAERTISSLVERVDSALTDVDDGADVGAPVEIAKRIRRRAHDLR
jgi:serine/threonine-protein kinase HipA